jgi:hypothetical protein
LDFDKKKNLLKEWLGSYIEKYKIEFADEGQPVNNAAIEERIKRHCAKMSDSEEYIYLLCVSTGSEFIPVYIGKSVNPITRWRSHLKKLLEGKESYLRWKKLLLGENDTAKNTLQLLIIPEDEIKNPPIPNFPRTVGSVEYQLVSLVSDAFPDTLLNKEGNRR